MKKIVSISVDEELHEKAKRLMNVSEVAEDAMKKKLNIIEIDASKPLVCDFCDREGYKETADMVESETNTKDKIKRPQALTLLYPDNKWICNSCLRIKARYVPAST